jgi:glutaminyl-peptide cyclotransferase
MRTNEKHHFYCSVRYATLHLKSGWITALVVGLALAVAVVSGNRAGAQQATLRSTLTSTTPVPSPTPAAAVEYLVPEVLSVRPHDTGAFTQGLLLHDGLFYESTGQYGESTLRQVDPETGDVLELATVPEQYFAEGLALVDDRLIQLTWKEKVAPVYDLETLEQVDSFAYEGEGWGLCYDELGERLIMSDGSATLYFRDPQTFDLLDPFETVNQVEVTFDGQPVTMLNELECVDGQVYANIWQIDFIIRIDPETGYVNQVINAAGLLTPEEIAALQPGSVLNGIAYDAENNVFYITGKRWPKLFEVRFVPFAG